MPLDRSRRDNDAWEMESAATVALLPQEQGKAGDARGARGEEKIHVFWRIFGGTILSIAALVCITFIQQFNNGLGELRAAVTHLSESRADLVKYEDFNNRMTAIWNNVKDLQGANAAVLALKERSALLEQQLKAYQDQTNARVSSASLAQKDMDAMHVALSAAKERSSLLEQQLKSAEDERKDLGRELQHLRERLAVLEGRQAALPPPAAPTATPASRQKP